MRRVLKIALATAVLGFAATPAFADALHGFCQIGQMCIDNGTNTPTSVNPPVFGFSASPGPATGTLLIDILVPDNISAPASFTFSGYLNGTATLFSSTPWTTGDLATYLGISASPTNPIGAFLPATQTYQPSATGFFVFMANLGSQTLPATGSTNDTYLSTLGQTVVNGTYIVAFLSPPGTATANSGAILETGVPEPKTWALMLLGFGGIGMALRRSRRRSNALMQVA